MSETIDTFGVILFHTNSSALRAEKILLKGGLTVKLIPTPREYSSDCGVALRFVWSDELQVRATLNSKHVEISSIKKLVSG
jgi:hypothetical protein